MPDAPTTTESTHARAAATAPSPVAPPARVVTSVHVHGIPDPSELPPGALDDSTRSRILAAGLGYFAEQGYHGTSIRDIAAASGVQPAALYRHFPGKEHILATLIVVGYDGLHRALRSALLDAGADARDQVRAYVHRLVVGHTHYWRLALVVSRELHVLSDEQAAPALALEQQIRDLGAEVVQRGIDRGEFEVPDVEATVSALIDQCVRIATWYRPGYRLSPEELASIHEELALRLLGALPTS